MAGSATYSMGAFMGFGDISWYFMAIPRRSISWRQKMRLAAGLTHATVGAIINICEGSTFELYMYHTSHLIPHTSPDLENIEKIHRGNGYGQQQHRLLR